MNISNSFWSICTDVLVNARQNKLSEAEQQLNKAQEIVENEDVDNAHLQKRKEHIELLRNHLNKKKGLTDEPALTDEPSLTYESSSNDLNILFILPESINSSLGFEVMNIVRRLDDQAISCIITIPENDKSIKKYKQFSIQTYQELLKENVKFPNDQFPDLVHVWTAQEIVRLFCEKVQKITTAKCIVHLQNHERYLTEKILGSNWQKLQQKQLGNDPTLNMVYHPINGPKWLHSVNGFTFSNPSLQQFNQTKVPEIIIPPQLDESLFYPRPINLKLREKLEIPNNHIVLVFPGTVRATNQEDIKCLYQAVDILNKQQYPTTLIRIGINRNPALVKSWPSKNVKELGWVDRNELPELLAAADIFIQPGLPGIFNETRIPAQLLEFFALGRPVVLPKCNLGTKATHNKNAFILDKADSSAMAHAVKKISSNKDLHETLSHGVIDFYVEYTSENPFPNLHDFYKQLLKTSQQETIKKFHSKQAENSLKNQIIELEEKVKNLEIENHNLIHTIKSGPTIDPLCISDPTFSLSPPKQDDFGIIVFGHTRLLELEALLKSLKKQDALKHTEVWLDGYQGKYELKLKIDKTIELINRYPVKKLHTQSSNFGFRKMIILGMIEMCKKYRDILILEDDCFPTRDAISIFRKELDATREDKSIFSVYGHHFLVDGEQETCNRFQGWGWATTSEKLTPILRQLIDCYSMTEENYLKFVNLTLTPEIKARIDVTPPRQPSTCLEKFFAWDETICLLTALNGQAHKPTSKRTIYNCGIGHESAHFKEQGIYKNPPFNLILPDDVWNYF